MPRNKNISRKRSLILLNNLEVMDERRKTININGSMRETGDPNKGNFRRVVGISKVVENEKRGMGGIHEQETPV